MTEKQPMLLRQIPQVDALLNTQKGRELASRFSPGLLSRALRSVLNQLRQALLAGKTSLPSADALLVEAEQALNTLFESRKPVVINATGVLLHTNLGRAPMMEAAAKAAYAVGTNYSVLEYDLDTGVRGYRQQAVESLAADLLGAESALVVNNNAAAVLLMLAALARGREVIVSRGELVEIGGSFRVPEVMSQSGCQLREVGATNKTKPGDYESAIRDETAALLKVHTSNYKVVGFTQSVDLPDLSKIARRAGLPLLADLGSGALLPLSSYGLMEEPNPAEALARGADVVCFSGDKLLGGPQAGILAGKKDLIAAMKRHPLMRALRPDKMTLAALEATFMAYQDEAYAKREIPLYQMLETGVDELHRRASALRDALKDCPILETEVIPSQAQLGGGSAPGEMLASIALSIKPRGQSVDALAKRLRLGEVPVITRIQQDRVLLDLLSVREEQLSLLAQLLKAACREGD